MHDFFEAIPWIAEAKIREAIEKGQFDNLPGQGKPLDLEDLSSMPAGLRLGYLLLKNTGGLPEELELRKEMAELESSIASCPDEGEKEKLRKKLQDKTLHYNILIEKMRKSSHRGV